MSRNERFEQILALLNRKKYLTIEELCGTLYVSPSTMRRDLSEMGRSGLLMRTRGGAAALTPAEAEDSVVHHGNLTFTKGQTRIAKQAAQMIQDGETVFLDTSRLSLCMVQFLKSRKKLTIVTNCLQLIMMLPDGRHNLICCSGSLSPRNLSVLDGTTASIASTFHYDKAFISCSGVFGGYTLSHSLETADLLGSVIERSDKSYLMCTREKLGRTAPVNVVPISRLTAVITDADETLIAKMTLSVPILHV